MNRIAMIVCLSAGLILSAPAFATVARIAWPSRHSVVVCGGRTEAGDLDVHVDSPKGLLVAETKDERVLVFIDLKKPGRAKWVIGEFWSKDDYEAREKILKTLPEPDAQLMRQLSTKRISEMYTGFTDGFVHMDISFGERHLSLSCQETKI